MVRRSGSARRSTQGSVDADNDRPASQSQGGDGFSGLPEAQQDEIIKRLMRFLLARNLKRRPTKRADLTRHVFHGMTSVRGKQRVFNGALSKARNKLKAIYAMEIATLVKTRRIGARGGGTGSTMYATAGTAGSAAATSQGGGGGSATKTTAYVLVSTLPEALRIAQPDRVAEWGLLTVIACMVVLTPGCMIRQEALYRALQRVGIEVEESEQRRKSHKQLAVPVRELVERDFPDQWYLARDKVDGEMCYALGPRMFREMGDETLLDFVEAVYSLSSDDPMDEASRDELLSRLKEARGEVENEESEEDGEGEGERGSGVIDLDDDDE